MDEWDAYFWPGSDVFKNIRGFRTADELKRFEYAATREASEELRRDPVQGRFDTAHYREIHRRLFHKVYEWAGEFRKVEFTKGDSSFAPLKTHAHTLESWTNKILGDLAAENHLKGFQKTAFVEPLTHHYNEINWVHAFRVMVEQPKSSYISLASKPDTKSNTNASVRRRGILRRSG